MSSAPPLTVCVPSIGRLEFLPALRRALEAQTFADFELLVLDNASSEAARDLFSEWAGADGRVRIVRSEDRISMFANFQRGYATARGRYFCFCHDDDVYAPDFLKAHHELLEANGSVGFSGSNNDFVDPEGRLLERRRWIRRTQVIRGTEFARQLLRRARNIVPMQGVVYRRSAVVPPGFDEALSCHYGDFVLLMRIAELHDVGLLADSLLSVRRHPQQTSAAMRPSAAVSLYASTMRAYFEEYRRRHPEAAGVVEDFRTEFRKGLRLAAIWCWLNADTALESSACLRGLEGPGWDASLGRLLRVLDRVGLAGDLRARWLARVARGLANRLSELRLGSVQ